MRRLIFSCGCPTLPQDGTLISARAVFQKSLARSRAAPPPSTSARASRTASRRAKQCSGSLRRRLRANAHSMVSNLPIATTWRGEPPGRPRETFRAVVHAPARRAPAPQLQSDETGGTRAEPSMVSRARAARSCEPTYRLRPAGRCGCVPQDGGARCACAPTAPVALVLPATCGGTAARRIARHLFSETTKCPKHRIPSLDSTQCVVLRIRIKLGRESGKHPEMSPEIRMWRSRQDHAG